MIPFRQILAVDVIMVCCVWVPGLTRRAGSQGSGSVPGNAASISRLCESTDQSWHPRLSTRGEPLLQTDPALTGVRELRRAQHQLGQPWRWKAWCRGATCHGCVKAGGGHALEFHFFWSLAGSVTLHLFYGALQEERAPAQSKQSHLYLL